MFSHISEPDYYANTCNYVSRGSSLSVGRAVQKVIRDFAACSGEIKNTDISL